MGHHFAAPFRKHGAATRPRRSTGESRVRVHVRSHNRVKEPFVDAHHRNENLRTGCSLGEKGTEVIKR